MTEPSNDPTRVLRDALRAWDAEQTAGAPGFEGVRRHLAGAVSPLEAPRWSVRRSVRLAGALAWAQVRVVPWAVAPAALAMMAMAVLAARFFGLAQGGRAAEAGFSVALLAGVAVTVAVALSPARADALVLAMPLGPQVVVLARLVAVLALDAVAALLATVLAARYATSVPALLAAWLVPWALVAGVAAVTAIWLAPWAGITAGLVVAPLAAPTARALAWTGWGGAVGNGVPPVLLVATGVALLAGCVTSARHASLHQWAAA